MENASKALVMAAGVLIGVLILSLAVYLFADFSSTASQMNSEINQQQVVQFNSKFTAYEAQEGLTIYDVITVASYAKENNIYYQNSEDYKIIVLYKNNQIQGNSQQDNIDLINKDKDEIESDNFTLPNYKCIITKYHSNGRVAEIKFTNP